MKKHSAVLAIFLAIFLSPASIQAAQNHGYVPLAEAVQRFEAIHKKKVQLPKTLPSLSFTHRVGKIDTTTKPPHLDISYINAKNRLDHFKMVVLRANGGIRLIPRIDRTYTMKDGTRAVYRVVPGDSFSFFLFQREGLEYHLGLHRQAGQKMGVHDFAKIAGSME